MLRNHTTVIAGANGTSEARRLAQAAQSSPDKKWDNQRGPLRHEPAARNKVTRRPVAERAKSSLKADTFDSFARFNLKVGLNCES
jgi:hypothetical protein